MRKSLISLLCLLFLFQVTFQEELYCYLQNRQEVLDDCLQNQLNSSITSLILTNQDDFYFDIQPLAVYLPKNQQLESIEISIRQVQSYKPFELCFRGLHNLKSVNLNLSYFRSIEDLSNLNFLVPMFKDQYKILTFLNLNIVSTITYSNILPVKLLFTELVNIENAVLNIYPSIFGNTLEGIEGLFKNCSKLTTLSFTLLFEYWNQEQLDIFSKVFEGNNSIQNLEFDIGNNGIRDITFMENIFDSISGSLEVLNIDIGSNPFATLVPLQKTFNKLDNLKELTFSIGGSLQEGQKFTNYVEFYQSLSTIFMGLKNVKYMKFLMSNFAFFEFKFEYFQNMFNIPQLEELMIDLGSELFFKIDDIGSMAMGITQIKKLELLLGNNTINKDSLHNLKQFFTYIPSIESLYLSLSTNYIFDIEQLEGVFDSLENLEELGLNLGFQVDSIFDRKYLVDISPLTPALQNLSTLKSLNLSFSSNAIKTLEPLEGLFTNLKNLEEFQGKFGSNCLENDSTFYEQQIKEMNPQIKEVDIDVKYQQLTKYKCKYYQSYQQE